MSYLMKRTPIKTVISGLAAAGTTTIYRTLLDGHLPSEWATYHATIDHTREEKIIDDLFLVFYDLAGQTTYLDIFTGEMAETIFGNVNAFVFVVDSGKLLDLSRAKHYLNLEIAKLTQFSPNALLFVLQHKADVIPPEYQDEAHHVFRNYFLRGISNQTHYISTSATSASFFYSIEEVLRLIIHDADPNIDFPTFKQKFWGETYQVILPSSETAPSSHYNNWGEQFDVVLSYLEDNNTH